MIRTLRISFSLKNAYRVNSILYAIRQIPLIKKLIPETVYQIRGFKIFANVLSVLWELVSAFLGKYIYFLLMLAGALALYKPSDGAKGELFLHLLVILTLIGAILNTYLLNPTKDKYYGVILLGMDAREYALVHYAYALAKLLLGFAAFGLLFGLGYGLPAWQCLLIPLFAAGSKLTVAAICLWDYERAGRVRNENQLDKWIWVLLMLLMAAAYGLPAAGIRLPLQVSLGVMGLWVVLGGPSLWRILRFCSFRAMYQELLKECLSTQMDKSAVVKLQREQSYKNISSEQGISSSRKGFAYLNELFIKRHKRILWQAALKLSAAALAVAAAVLIAFSFVPQLREKVNEVMMHSLPYFVFVMYLINRGTGFTRALFVNCDHSLLTYSFYKNPRFILKLFWIRLAEIVKVNLLPAAVVGAGLAALLYASGGTDQPINYVVLVVSVLCLSVFFSVHYLTLYYLLQPYNAGTELKSGTYQLITWATYVVCYLMMRIEMPTLFFGFLTIAFCVLYCAVASILVYRLAPKTFKIRN